MRVVDKLPTQLLWAEHGIIDSKVRNKPTLFKWQISVFGDERNTTEIKSRNSSEKIVEPGFAYIVEKTSVEKYLWQMVEQ